MSRVDLVATVAEQLEQAILSGQYPVGKPLPAERAISARLKVSRSVVREAIGRLASLGMVKGVHGSGNLVQSPTTRPILIGYQRLLQGSKVRLEDLSAVRLPLETAIAAQAATMRSAEHLARLARTQKVLASARRTLEVYVKADLEFHAILAEATGNPLFQVVLTPIQELLIESRRVTLGRHGHDLAFRHHAAILEAVAAGDAAEAGQAMRRHLETNYDHLHGG